MITRAIPIFLMSLITSLAQQPPEDFVKLRENYDQAIQRATKPITAAYITELRKLQDKHTRAGNLDAALLLKQELERLSVQGDGVPTASAPGKTERVSTSDKKVIESRLIGRMWGRPDDAVHSRPRLFFRKDGTLTRVLTKVDGETTQANGTWQLLKSGVVKVDLPNVRALFYRFPTEDRCLEFVEPDSDEAGTPYFLVPDAVDPKR